MPTLRYWRLSSQALAALLWVSACSDVSPTNPYDTSTPPAAQAPAAIAGKIELAVPRAKAAGLRISLRDAEDRPVVDANGQVREVLATALEGDGVERGRAAFKIGALVPGLYSVFVAVEPGYLAPSLPAVAVAAGETRLVGTLVFTRVTVGSGRISGTVKLKDGQGGPREVTLYQKLGQITQIAAQQRTHEDGHFAFGDLAPGIYAVGAELTGFTPDLRLGLALAQEEGGLASEIVLEDASALTLYPVTAVLLPTLEKQFGTYYTNADSLPLVVLPFGGMPEMRDARLANNREFLDDDDAPIAFEPHQVNRTVALPEVEGAVSAYAQFRAKTADFEFTSDVFDTEVVRDVSPPRVVGLSLRGLLPDASGVVWLREDSATVSVDIQGNDAVSAVAGYAVHHDLEGSIGEEDTLALARLDAAPGYMRIDKSLQLFSGQGPKVIAVYLKDRAGNLSEPARFEVVVDSLPPELAAGSPLIATNASQQGELDSRVAMLRVRVPEECRGEHPTAAAGVCPVDFRAGVLPLPTVGLYSPFRLGSDDTVSVPILGGNNQSVSFAVELRDQAGNVASYDSPLYTMKLVGRLSGRVLVQGYPDEAFQHGGVTVSLYEPGAARGLAVAQAVTAPDGSFSLRAADEDPNLATTRLPAGHYIITIQREDLEPFEAETDVRENETSVLPAYRVAAARGNVRGRFVRSDRRDSVTAHSGIEVSALRGGSVVARAYTLDDGTFTFPAPGLPVTVGADRYELVAYASGYAARKVEGLVVTRSETTTVNPSESNPFVPLPFELAKLSGDFTICDAPTGECIPTLYSNASSVRVKLLDATGVSEIRVQGRTEFAADSLSPAWQPFSAAGIFSAIIAANAAAAEGSVSVFVQTKVSGTAGPVLRSALLYDKTPPTLTSFQIAQGNNATVDGFTNQTTVRTRVEANAGTGAVSPLQSAYVAFAAAQPGTLPSTATPCLFETSCLVALPAAAGAVAEGVHNGWAWACDQARNCSTAPATARIIYDQTPPKATNGLSFVPSATWITLSGGAYYSRTSRVDIKLGVGTAKTNAGVAVVDLAGAPLADVVSYRFGLLADVTDAPWTGFTARPAPASTPTVTGPALAGDDGKYRVFGQFRDAAGNVTEVDANPRFFDVTLDTTPPAVLFALNAGAPFTTNPLVNLDVTSAAGDAGSAREVLLTLDGGLFNTVDRRTLPLVGSGAKLTLPSASAPEGDGPYPVNARFFDAAGNVSDRAATIWLDRTKPRILSLVCGTCRTDPSTGQAYTNDSNRQVVMDLVALDNSGQIASVKAKIGAAPPQTEAYTGNFTATFEAADAAYPVAVSVFDPASNESVVETVIVNLDRQAPLATVLVNDGAASTTSAAVTVTIENTDGKPIAGLRVSNTSTFTGPMLPFSRTVGWRFPNETIDSARTIYVQLTDPAGNVGTFSDTIVLDTHAPSTPVVTITAPATLGPGNAISTTAITLGIAATDALGSLSSGQLMVTGDLNFSGSGTTGWLSPGQGGATFAGNFAFSGALTPGDGPKTLSIVVRDAAGNQSGTATVRFNLQASKPTNVSATMAPSPFTPSTAVTFSLFATGASQMQLASGRLASVNGAPANVGAWIPYSSAAGGVLLGADEEKTITVRFRNDAGLEADPIPLKTTLDTLPPTGTFTLAGTADLGATSIVRTNTLKVNLQLTATDGAGSGLSEVRVADTLGGLTGAAWRTFQDQLAWTLPSGDGAKSVFIQLRDRVGNASSGTITATIIFDSIPPTAPRFAALPIATSAGTQLFSLQTPATDVHSGPPRYAGDGGLVRPVYGGSVRCRATSRSAAW